MNRMRPKLIGICGGSGSGKSWLVERLAEVIPGAASLSLDSFYRDRSGLPMERRDRINYDHPRCIDWAAFETALRDLKEGRETFIPSYDFATHSRRQSGQRFAPQPMIFVEGLWLLRKPSVRRLFDLTFFMACPARQRLTWRLERDQSERGRTAESIRKQFAATVNPMHDQFVEPQKRFADVSICQPFDVKGVEAIFNALWPIVSGDQIQPAHKREEFRRRLANLLAREAM